jgi:hypothetical protein
MRLEPTDQIKLEDQKLVITRQGQPQPMIFNRNSEFIKEKLGFFERIHSWICSVLFSSSENYWKKKNISIGSRSVPMYILENKLPHAFLPDTHMAQKVLTKPPADPGMRHRVDTRPKSPETEPLLGERPATPTSASSASTASSRPASPVTIKKFEPTPAQLKQIVNANRLCEWIGELRKPECKVKINGLDLSLEPRGGVKHDLIDSSVSTRAYNLLACTFITLQTISPSKWKPSDSSKPSALNYDKYIDACNDTIAQLKAKKSMSSDDEINLGLINAALILAKGFQQIKSGSTKTDKTFLGSQFNLNILADYVIKYDQFGSKKLT